MTTKGATTLLIDFGGVLTSSVFDSFRAFCDSEGLPPDHFITVLSSNPTARKIFVAVEKGEISEPDFERDFAPFLGPEIAGDGLLRRLTGGLEPDEAMLAAVRRLRDEGFVTVLVSNSFGMDAYDGYDIDGLFDHVVISGNVGTRKPGRMIYTVALEEAGCTPDRAFFVDDLEQNVTGASRVGVAGLVHRDADSTIAALDRIFTR